jgi:cytochrome c oxidase assembly factor 6
LHQLLNAIPRLLAAANVCDSSEKSPPISPLTLAHFPTANMAWLPWGSSDDSGVKKTSGGAFESPSRTNRKKCYEARDSFFECLDKNNILDSINTKSGKEKAATFCSQFDQEFEKNCAHSWVSWA